MAKLTKLKTGLRILTIPQRSTRTVAVLALVGTGAKYEEKRINGVSHFLEHMFFKGTKKRPTPLEITSPIENAGGMFNAFTSQEFTGYFIKVDAVHIQLALDLVADIFLHSLFPIKEIEKEKGVVIEEINMRHDTPMVYVGDLWERFLYKDQPAGFDVAGTKESVQRLSRKDMLGYMRQQYVASNTVLCVAGNIKESNVIHQIEQLFQSIAKTPFKEKAPVKEEQERPGVLVEERATDQTHIALGGRAYNLFHEDRFAQNLLATILGNGMSSRLFLEIRERLALAYYISTTSEANPDTGYVATFAGVRNDNAAKAIQAIEKEYRRIAEKGVSKKELRNAKDRVKGQLALSLEPSEAKAEFYGMQEILENRFFTPEEIYGKIEKVKTSDIKRVAGSIFLPAKTNLVVLGPFKKKEPFEKLLL